MAKVENAIILAAGMGSRMVPLTYEIPKGLVKVRGESLVERQICQLMERGIMDILLVTGYLEEQFKELEEKYAGVVRCIYNPDYEVKNNISSLYLVRNDLKNTYILSCDNYYTENIFQAEEDGSWYCVIKDDVARAEWGVELSPEGRIIEIQKTAEANQPFLYGAVYFEQAFSEKFRQILEIEYAHPKNHALLWEDILKKYLADLEIKAKIESKNIVYELESFEELREFDRQYQATSGNALLGLIADIFAVSEKEIVGIMPQKLGMTNHSFVFRIKDEQYIFRLPGQGSQQFIDRQKEAFVYQELKDKDITDRLIYINGENGIKIARFEEESRTIHIGDKEQLKKAIQMLKEVHESGIRVEEEFGVESCKRYEAINSDQPEFFENYKANRHRVEKLSSFLRKQGIQPVFCHTDFVQENILCLKDGNVRLIDWEYSAMSEPMVDLAVFIICGWYQEEDLKELALQYFDRELEPLDWFRVYYGVVLSALTWAAWSKHKEYHGYYFQEEDYPQKIYSYVEPYLKKAEQWMEKCNG